MHRLMAVCVVLLLAACSGDDAESGEPELSEFLQEWVDLGVEQGDDYEGQPLLIDEDQQVIYMDDCDLADEATSEGGPYGPKAGEAGYASICPN